MISIPAKWKMVMTIFWYQIKGNKKGFLNMQKLLIYNQPFLSDFVLSHD